jgi:hypothetical protein
MVDWRKHEYLALCGLRAFPQQQLRKLLIALQDSSLPLTHAPVHHLLRQLLYHVGPAEDGELQWKRDIPGLMNEFKEVFVTLAEEFSAKPRAHEALPALVDLLNYFIQWESCDPLATLSLISGCCQLSETALKWAKEALSDMTGLQSDRQDALVAKVKLFGLYAALCTPQSTLRIEDAQRLLVGLVYAQNSIAFKVQTAEEKEMLKGLRCRVDAVAVQKLAEVMNFAKSSDEFITTGVSATLEHVPETLQWEQVGTTPCFHAEDQGTQGDQGHLYSINLLTGVVLLDGYPPRRIPATIAHHRLFRRCFGDAVFEVGVAKKSPKIPKDHPK